MRRIAQSLTQWEEQAQSIGIPKREISAMAESIRPRLRLRLRTVFKATGT